MKYFVVPRKIERVRKLPKKLSRESLLGRRWVSRKELAHFCGVCVSLSLAMPWARFYTRSMYWDMAKRVIHSRSRNGSRVRLSHQSLRDLAVWKRLAGRELQGRENAVGTRGRIYAQRRSRSLLRWYARFRPDSRISGAMGSSRRVGLDRSSRLHHPARIKSHQTPLDWKICEKAEGTQSPERAASCQQSGSGSYHEHDGIGKSTDYARASKIEKYPRPCRLDHTVRVDTFSSEQVCRRFVATVTTRRPPDPAAAVAFRSGWYGSTNKLLYVSPSRRASSAFATASIQRASFRLGSQHHEAPLSTDRLDTTDSAEARLESGSGSAHHPIMASATMVRKSNSPSDAHNGAALSTGADMARGEEDQPTLEDINSRGEPSEGSQTPRIRMKRAQTTLQLTDAAMTRLANDAGVLAASAKARELVRDYAWSGRTLSTRSSQWRAWVEFCETETQNPLPISEAHLVGFIGWLALEREAGRRNVSSTSIPQYLSAARQMQIALTGLAPPQFPFVKHAHRAYKKWEEEDFPKLEVRMGITADVVQRIWYLGMTEHAGLPTI